MLSTETVEKFGAMVVQKDPKHRMPSLINLWFLLSKVFSDSFNRLGLGYKKLWRRFYNFCGDKLAFSGSLVLYC